MFDSKSFAPLRLNSKRSRVSACLVLASVAVLTGCVTRQSRIVEELSSRSRIPTSELRQLLNDCSRTQLSMNICAFRDFVASDLELKAALEMQRKFLPQQCQSEIDDSQSTWEAERDRACDEETALEKGGSMRPMLISACKTTATDARIIFVKRTKSCRLEHAQRLSPSQGGISV